MSDFDLESRKSNKKSHRYSNQVDRLRFADCVCVKYVQQISFQAEISRIDKPIDVESRLLQLAPFRNADGILRVGGRLSNADIDNLNAGISLLSSIVRQKF